MLKKFMVAFLATCLLIRGSALIFLLVRMETELPTLTLGTTAMVCTVFVILLFRYFAEGIKRREIEFALLLNAAVVLFNMLCTRFGTPASIDTFELMAMGTFFEVVVGITLVVLSKQRTRKLTGSRF